VQYYLRSPNTFMVYITHFYFMAIKLYDAYREVVTHCF